MNLPPLPAPGRPPVIPPASPPLTSMPRRTEGGAHPLAALVRALARAQADADHEAER